MRKWLLIALLFSGCDDTAATAVSTTKPSPKWEIRLYQHGMTVATFYTDDDEPKWGSQSETFRFTEYETGKKIIITGDVIAKQL